MEAIIKYMGYIIVVVSYRQYNNKGIISTVHRDGMFALLW